MCFSIVINHSLSELEQKYNAKVFTSSYENMNNILDSKSENTRILKKWDDQSRIFPNSFAPIIAQNKSEKNIFFMRYRLRPNGSKNEVPTKFNLYNARIENLQIKDSWKNIFMKKHGVIIFKSFFEWVKDQNNLSTLVKFTPQDHQEMIVPCLFDNWISEDKQVKFSSFAIITDNAPTEIKNKGHDRCPIVLKKDNIDHWLNPKGQSVDKIFSLLTNKKDTLYECLNVY